MLICGDRNWIDRAAIGRYLLTIAIATAALAVVPAANADAAVINPRAAGCTDGRVPNVLTVRTVNVPAYQSRWRIPRWLVACSGVTWLKTALEYDGPTIPRKLTLHGASWTVGTWAVRQHFVKTREGGYMHFVLSKGRQRLISTAIADGGWIDRRRVCSGNRDRERKAVVPVAVPTSRLPAGSGALLFVQGASDG